MILTGRSSTFDLTRVVTVVSFVLLSGQALAQYSPNNPLTVQLELFADGLDATVGGVDQRFPTDMVAFPDGSGRLLVQTMGGILRLIDASGSLQTAIYADTTSAATFTSNNLGITTVEFHPDFASTGTPGFGRFYTVETELTQASPPPDFPGSAPDFAGSNQAHDRVLYEYTQANIAANTFSGTKREVLRIHEHRRGHDVNDLAFDANGYLYIASGDSEESVNGQDLGNVFGKILRIDPIAPSDTPGSTDPVSANGKYRVPLTNPFLNDAAVIDEIFAYGLRNPFRISVDGSIDQLIVTSNGSDIRETVYHIDLGDNLGWPIFEGTVQIGNPPPGFTFRPPVFEYDQGIGRSINGVFVYRGTDIAGLSGLTVFADFFGPAGNSGPRLFYGNAANGGFSDMLPDPVGLAFGQDIVSVGEDAGGELYLLSRDGTILRVAESPDTDSDGVLNEQDNCSIAANPGQVDADGDGFGNVCDADLNNDCSVNAIDLGLLKTVFFTADSTADFNSDGAVNALDLGVMKIMFFGQPGPSGVPNGCQGPT